MGGDDGGLQEVYESWKYFLTLLAYKEDEMIFVTVGTHEQPFNRLVEHMDKWAKKNDEKVIMQTGFSTYTPQNCEWRDMYPFQVIMRLIEEAHIVITHGGPSSIFFPLSVNTPPIVVPRMKMYKEHINNHQVEFSRILAKRQGNIIVVENIKEIDKVIDEYDILSAEIRSKKVSNNTQFCSEFETIVNDLMIC